MRFSPIVKQADIINKKQKIAERNEKIKNEKVSSKNYENIFSDQFDSKEESEEDSDDL